MMIQTIADAATAPMDVMMKRQQKLTQEMLKYSFILGQKLGYIKGYSEGKAGQPEDPESSVEALSKLINQVKH